MIKCLIVLIGWDGFPGGSDGKESACSVRDLGSIPRSGRSPGEGNSTPAFLPGEFHRQRNLAGYSSWGQKKSDTTERISLFTFTGWEFGHSGILYLLSFWYIV